MENRILLKKDTVLNVGDFLLERSRFDPKDEQVFVITRMEADKDVMYIKRISTTKDRKLDIELFSNISAHSAYNNRTAWLTYKLLPNHPLVLLYGNL